MGLDPEACFRLKPTSRAVVELRTFVTPWDGTLPSAHSYIGDPAALRAPEGRAPTLRFHHLPRHPSSPNPLDPTQSKDLADMALGSRRENSARESPLPKELDTLAHWCVREPVSQALSHPGPACPAQWPPRVGPGHLLSKLELGKRQASL